VQLMIISTDDLCKAAFAYDGLDFESVEEMVTLLQYQVTIYIILLVSVDVLSRLVINLIFLLLLRTFFTGYFQDIGE